MLKEQHRATAVLLLFQVILHLLEGSLEEEGYQALIGPLTALGFQGIDVLLAVFLANDEFRKVILQQNKVGQ